MAAKNTARPRFTVPGLSLEEGLEITVVLQARLHALNDLQLTLKHAHWNVVGREFIGVHRMLDPQILLVRAMIDEIAERIATMGASPNGLPGALVKDRDWDDYSIGRAQAAEHLAALDLVYTGVISSHRQAIEKTGKLDPVTEDMLITQCAQLELFQWFMRAHLEDPSGVLEHTGAESERAAARKTK